MSKSAPNTMSDMDAMSPDDPISGNHMLNTDLLHPTLVRASAGTGKTYRLTARLLKILLQGAAPESILATTFTRKAAGEILQRVLLTLARAADENDPNALSELRSQVGIATLPRSVCLNLLDTLLRNLHRLRVCTLDSLFAQLARSFPFELGLPPAWRLTDEIEESWLKERAVDSVITMLDRSEMMTVLSMLGKGDVKRSIARELLQVVDAAYSRSRLCNDDVWNKLDATRRPGANELARAAEMFRSADTLQMRQRTKLEKLADSIESREFASLVDDTLVANIAAARRNHEPVRYYTDLPDELNDSLDTLYRAVRSHVLSVLRAQNEATAAVLAAYDHHIAALKRASRVLGFDDVAVLLARQFASLDQRVLSSRMDGAIDHVLLDEFQDTSPAQWQVIQPLASRVAASEVDSQKTVDDWKVQRSFFCVGDTKQAIYGWRGGVAEIFDAVADQIDGVVEVEQNESFRSSPVIIDVVNDMFKNLPRHPLYGAAAAGDPTDKSMYEASAVTRFARRFPHHKAYRKSLPGHVRFESSGDVKDGDSEALRLACFEHAANLAADLYRSAPGKSVGILTRTNQGVAQLIYLLERRGVEVSQEGGNPLTDSAAVELVLSALMMAEHPGDLRWEFHVSSTPWIAIPGFGADFVRHLVEDRGLSETIEFLGDHLASKCDARDTLRLKQLARLAIAYELNAAARLRDFVRLVREKRVERPQAAPVRVMTVHQAKGLEFDAVVLPELDGALTRQSGQCVSDVADFTDPPRAMTRYLNNKSWHFLAHNWQRAFGAQASAAMTESLCLLYVAMTRAKQALHLVIQPAKKAEFQYRTPAALIYHALGCDQDPTQELVTLFERGDPNWMLGDHDSQAEDPTLEPPAELVIEFQPR